MSYHLKPSKLGCSNQNVPDINSISLTNISKTIILSLFVAVAFSVSPNHLKISGNYGSGIIAVFSLFFSELTTPSLLHSLLFFAWIILHWKLSGLVPKKQRAASVLGFVYSVLLLFGKSFSVFHDFSFIGFRPAQVPIAIVTLCGYFVFFRDILIFIFHYLDTHPLRKESIIPNSLKFTFFQKHTLVCIFIILLFCWIIVSIPFFPGNIPHDGRYQLNVFYGEQRIDQHHPILSTIFLGGIHYLGSFLGGYNSGTFLVVSVQFLFAAWVFSRIVEYIYSHFSFSLAIFSIAFYALCPMWWTYNQTIMKDTVFFILFALFALDTIKALKNQHQKSLLIEWIIVSIVICLFRHNGIYIVIPSLSLILFFSLHQTQIRNRILLVLCAVVFCFAGSSFLLNKVLRLPSGKPLEAYSVPLQGLARYVIKHQNELKENEIEIIDRVVQYEGMEDRYVPEFADRIKDRYRPGMTKNDFKNFWVLYLNLLKKDPICFLEGIGNHIFGYTNPEYTYKGMARYQLYIKDSLGPSDNGRVYASYILPKFWRTISTSIVDGWNSIPLLSLFVNPAAYTWFYLFGVMQAIRKRQKRNMALYSLPFLNILICFVSPVNGLLRYALPVMVVMPLFLSMILQTKDLEVLSDNG